MLGATYILSKKSVLLFAHTLLFFFFIWEGVSQDFSNLSEEDRWKIRSQSYVLVDIDRIDDSNLSFLTQGESPLAVYILEFKEDYLPVLKELMAKKSDLLILSGANHNRVIFPENKAQLVPFNVVDTILRDSKTTSKDILHFTAEGELNLVTVNDKEAVRDSVLVKFWRTTGRLPNLIQGDPENFIFIDSIVQGLNQIKRVFGTVTSKGRLLDGVGFKNHSDLRVNGNFSFPILSKGELPVFIPHKAGFYFSPDIIRTTSDNSGNLKEFVGFPLDPEYGLTDYFSFSPTIKNNIRKNNRELIVNKVDLFEDRSRGKVGYFNNGAYMDAGLDSRMALQSSFTISAWIKPTVLGKNNSILGKGENFVLKLHDGFLTFTMADIKDYISRTSPVPLNEWTQVALVHSKLNSDLSFFINGVQTDKIQLIEDYDTSDYNLVVGSNLWQEFFVGYMDYIKIWNRELNPDEIRDEFLDASPEESYGIFKFIISIIMVVVVPLIALYFWNKRKGKNKVLNHPAYTKVGEVRKTTVVQEISACQEKILCFGPLKIIVADGTDIAKKLSPKLKQLFLIVMLHSVGSKKGISTKKLTEYLWPGMTPSSAKNTRGTNIQNLRAILADSTTIQLVFREKNWFLEVAEDCYWEYQEVLHYLNIFGKEDIGVGQREGGLRKLLGILKEERFLANIEDDWLDPFVERLSNDILDLCQEVALLLNLEEHISLLQDLVSVMHIYDDLNETALQLRLQILIKQGNLSTAHSIYDKFTKLYNKLYGEKYPIKFEELISAS